MASSPFQIGHDRTPAPYNLNRLGKWTPYRTYHVKTVEEVNTDRALLALVSEGLAALKQLGKEDKRIERAEQKRKREEEKFVKKIMGGPLQETALHFRWSFWCF